jgi:signal transduction histidine kinase
LLSNALKFTKPHDLIDVRIGLLEFGDSEKVELKIEVKDRGIGISEEEQLLIFKPSFRSTNPASLK